MLKFLTPILLFASILFTVNNAAADAQKTVYWGQVHYPPIFIQNGPDKNQGMIDIVVNALRERLPDYNHQTLPLSLSRLMTEMKSGTQICFAGLFKTAEREKFIAFSEQFSTGAPALLITAEAVDEQIPQYLDEKGYVDLRKLLAEGMITLDISAGRSFGEYVDGLIKLDEATFHPSVRVNSGMNDAEKTIKLIGLGRVEATLTHGLETYYQAVQQGVTDQISMYRIQGNLKRASLYVGCSKGEWAGDFMPNLNLAIAEIVRLGIPTTARNRWLPKNLW
ncbi:MAG: TIGR02285 family protein [Sneathiella sp.]|nr:TIGR02285 family protein [Sneathiella sp.]